MRKLVPVIAAAQIMILAGCVPAVMAPSVIATPGPGKLPADLASDHIACTAQANQQMAPAVQAANNQVTGTALQNLLTGTGNDAVAVNAQATATVQQQYDIAYSACMYAKGDNVPPNYMQPTQYAEPTGAHRGKRRTAHKPSSPTTASGSGQGTGPGFVVPAAAAPAGGGGGGFVEPAATASAAPAASSGGFAVPPPAAH